MKRFVRDLPLSAPPQQSEDVRSTEIRSRQFAGPTLNLQVHDGDGLDNLNARKARFNIRSRSVLNDPFKYVLGGAAVLDALAVTGDGSFGMKGRPHKIAITGAGARNVGVDGASDGAVLLEIRIGRFGS